MSDYEPTDLIGAAEREEAEKAAERRAVTNEVGDFKWLMSDKRGRRVVWRLLENTGVFKSSFTGNSETFFREGQRNVGLRLMAMLNDHCADEYTQMVKEQQKARQ